MTRMSRLIGLSALCVMALTAGCASAELASAEDLAAKVEIAGYQKLGTNQKADMVEVFFFGTDNPELSQAMSLPGWSPAVPPAEFRSAGAYEWLAEDTMDHDGRQCSVNLLKLRPGFEAVATELDPEQRASLTAGRASYVKVTFNCDIRG